MSLKPYLNSTAALFRKLERESYRAYHQPDRIHKADHFYNFCVTAHALRDYFLSERGITSKPKQDKCHTYWNKIPVLVAVKDIANSSKHFSLRNAPQTKKVRGGTGDFVDVYENDTGDIILRSVKAPEIYITLSDGQRHDLYLFTEAVLTVWREFLKLQRIKVRRQPFAILQGRKHDAVGK